MKKDLYQAAARPGDVYAVPLADGRYGAIRVLQVSEQEGQPSSLVAVTTWLADKMPSLDEPQLRVVLRRWRGRFEGSHALCWYTGRPPAVFTRLGSVAPSPEELALDAQGAYGGSWHDAMARDVVLERMGGGQPSDVTRISPTDVDRLTGTMTATAFWSAIGLIDWAAEDDGHRVEPLVQYLAHLPASTIAGFHRRLCGYLAALDQERFADQIGVGRYRVDQPFSADHFLDVRCAVVANGREFYDSVLADPRRMPRDLEFEPLLTVADVAYRRKTGRTAIFLGAVDV